MNGKLIVIDGLDGSGKATQTALVAQRIASCGKQVRQISFPDYSDPSSALVQMYLKGEFGSDPAAVNAYAASSFYAVDRYASYMRHWKDDYLAGAVITADRYTTSNAIHQMSKLPRDRWDGYLDWLFSYEYDMLALPKPDLMIFLDMPLEVSQKLLSQRYNGDAEKKDIHERALGYLAQCRECAQFTGLRTGWSTVECADGGSPKSRESICDDIFSIISKAGLV